jgi:hypothetical protein
MGQGIERGMDCPVVESEVSNRLENGYCSSAVIDNNGIILKIKGPPII